VLRPPSGPGGISILNDEEIAMFERLRYRFAVWRATRDNIRQLSWLDDRLLADAGLDRTSLKARARASAERHR
jgi:uncharacterized protein YjiS (DUF1127 family)